MPLGEWTQATPSDGPDPSKLEGARKLAEKINAYWAQRGINANAHAVLMPFSPAMREAFYTIRSDLVVQRDRVIALPRQERTNDFR